MSQATVHVVAHSRAKPGHEEALMTLLVENTTTIRQEPGCIRYEVFQNEANPGDFVCLEEWASDTVLDTHRDAPHTRGLHQALEPLLAAPMDIRRYRWRA